MAACHGLADHPAVCSFSSLLEVERLLIHVPALIQIEVFRIDQLSVGHDHGPLDPIFKFTDISGPAPRIDRRKRVRRKSMHLGIHFGRKPRKEVFR